MDIRKSASRKIDSLVNKHFAWRFASRRRLERLEETLDFVAAMIPAQDDLVTRVKELSNFLTESSGLYGSGSECLVGKPGDGSYVLHSSFKRANSLKVLSIGVGDKISAESDLADYGAKVWLFDHTISALPVEREEFTFIRRGLGADSADSQLLPLPSMVDHLALSTTDHGILMIDAEGAEWQICAAEDEAALAKFAQVSIELHGLTGIVDERRWKTMRATLEVLTANHTATWLHGNNWRPSLPIGGRMIPDVCEVTFLRRDVINGSRREKNLTSPDAQRPNTSLFPDLPQSQLFRPLRPTILAESRAWLAGGE